MVKVEVIYIACDQTLLQCACELPDDATVADAINASGVYKKYPETKGLPVGVFSKSVSLDKRLRSGDRIEVYRPLTLDPKEKRRQRAEKR